MQWIREEDEATEVRLCRSHARDASAERLPASDHVVTVSRGFDEDRNRALSGSARQVDSDRVDAAALKPTT